MIYERYGESKELSGYTQIWCMELGKKVAYPVGLERQSSNLHYCWIGSKFRFQNG